MPTPPKKNIIVTFDVDGTLLTSGSNTAHKNAMDKAIKHVWKCNGCINDLCGKHKGVSLQKRTNRIIDHVFTPSRCHFVRIGMTDQMIMADVLRLHGYKEDEIWSKMPEAAKVRTYNPL